MIENLNDWVIIKIYKDNTCIGINRFPYYYDCMKFILQNIKNFKDINKIIITDLENSFYDEFKID